MSTVFPPDPARCKTRLVVAVRLRPHGSGYLDRVPEALEAIPADCAVRLLIPPRCWGVSHALLTAIAELSRTASAVQVDCADPESPACTAILAVLAGVAPLSAVGIG